MRSLLILACMLCGILASAQQGKKLSDSTTLEPVELTSVKAGAKDPFAKTNLSKEDIRKKNIGQDLPFILNNTPSVTVNSDAGNGIGYTGIHIRGTDATRINVTLNGIPYNDQESLATYLVDLPDFASSTGSIQVQRGVGTSANGAGSFGGSINLGTNELNAKKSFELSSTAGSYGSFKNTLLFNSGLFSKYFSVDARISDIRTQGYIDRAAVRLRSYFFSTGFIKGNNSLRLNVFSGHEKTYQAWNGVAEAALDTNRRYNSAGTEKAGTPYENQVDNYTQTHYQFFYDHKYSPYLKTNIAVFLTRGKGYYEEYKASANLGDYGLPVFGTVTQTDLIRRLWLNNYFYGSIFSAQYHRNKTQLVFGGGYTRYDGQHYGEIIWAQEQAAVPMNYRWYDVDANKSDLSAYIKWTQSITKNLQTFIDLQGRNIRYKINGFADNPSLTIDKNYTFFGPKAGLSFYQNGLKLYASYARAVKEPNRDDFEASKSEQPKPEKLNDFEGGAEYKNKNFSAGADLYYMKYRDQLVLTGKINDVGEYTRTNIPDSYRAGIELFADATLNKTFSLSGNITFSKNKIKHFTEYIDDYDNGGQVMNQYNTTDISFSPNIISSIGLDIIPVKNALLTLTGKYVSKQYLDNTSNENRRLRAYYTQDIRAGYTFHCNKIKEINLFGQVNNVFSKLYEPNGYTYSYYYGGLQTENFYFPMAPVNFVVGLDVKF